MEAIKYLRTLVVAVFALSLSARASQSVLVDRAQPDSIAARVDDAKACSSPR